jgi:hypothetical protein
MYVYMYAVWCMCVYVCMCVHIFRPNLSFFLKKSYWYMYVVYMYVYEQFV